MKKEYLQGVLAAIGGGLGWYLGGFDGLLLGLVAMSAADYVSGVAAAIVKREVSSKTGAAGIARKTVMFLVVGAAHMVDKLLLGEGSAVRTAVVFFYLSNELISLLENGAELGLPIPDVLKNTLEKLKKR
jgi:toxin secretion/phage lysis holin